MNHNEPTASPVPPVNAEEEFTAFMRAYQDTVFATAVRLTANRAQAEDIAQEVFLRAHARFAQLRASPTAGGWLKTVATNLALNHLSRYRRRWRFFSELRREDTDEGPGPEVEFAAPDEPRAPVEAAERRAQVEQRFGIASVGALVSLEGAGDGSQARQGDGALGTLLALLPVLSFTNK